LDILFKTVKMEKIFNSERELQRKYGRQTEYIKRRMAVLRAAATLDQISHLPPERCHELEPKGRGRFAVDLKDQYRLVIRVANEPIPKNADGGIDKTKVTVIEIQDVEDYH